MFNLVHLFLSKGIVVDGFFFSKYLGEVFSGLANQGKGNELEAISTSALKIRDKKTR